jgi:hypothetical protein
MRGGRPQRRPTGVVVALLAALAVCAVRPAGGFGGPPAHLVPAGARSRGAGSGPVSGPDPAPGTAVAERAAPDGGFDRGDTSTTWLSEEAAADSLAAFWGALDEYWLGATDPDLPRFSLDEAKLDSLVVASDRQLARMASGRYARFSFDPLEQLGFNRVQGLVLGAAVAWDRAVAVRSRLALGAGYGFGNHNFVWHAKLDVPLVTRRRDLPRGLGRGEPYRRLALQAGAYREARMFGGDGRKIRYATAFVYGSDPNQYYDAVGGRARLIWRPTTWLRVHGGFSREEHRPLAVTTDWNLAGRNLRPSGNLAADPLLTTGAEVGLAFVGEWLDASVAIGWHDLDDAPEGSAQPGAPGLWRTRAQLGVDLLDRHGNRYLLRGRFRGSDRRAPTQWRVYLGDYGTLRGYPHMELAGDQGASASLDVRWGFDLWRSLRVPGLRRLGLQTITFVDWGRTWAEAEAGANDYGAQGWRMDAGVGLGKFVGVPGRSGNLRLYVAHQIFDGQRDQGWRLLIAFEK